MRENRNNQYRPEQIEIYKQLRATNANSELLMEYPVTYTNEQDEKRTAIGDIVDVTKKIFYRLSETLIYYWQNTVIKFTIRVFKIVEMQ